MSELNELRRVLSPKVLGVILWLCVFSFSVDKSYRNNTMHIDSRLMCSSDPEGYYQYLPTLVNDTPFDQMNYAHILENGNRLNLFMIGVAVMQAPFFFGTLAYTELAGIEADHYGKEFFIGMATSNAFYSACAFLLLFLSLHKRFGRATSLAVLAVLFFGTNVVYYTARDPITSHMYAFFLVSVLIYLSTKNHFEGFKKSRVWGMLVCGGLLTLVRIPHVLLLGIPMLLYLKHPGELKERVLEILSARMQIIGALVFIGALWFLQSSYWHHVTGEWFISTYSFKGEGFNWSDPHFFDVLLSHQNGFFIYAPLMLIPVLWSLYRLIKGDLANGVVLGYFLFIATLYGFWWCWWLGGAYGHRGFIDILPLLCLPLAEVFLRMRNWPSRALLPTSIAFLILMSVSYSLSVDYWWPWEGELWTWETLHEKLLRAITRPWKADW